jgi:hypothetical protein
VTRGLGFSGLIRRNVYSVVSYNTHRDVIEDETKVLCQSRCGMGKMI